MPGDVSERLSRFTPDDSGLDRAALFFAAGRASVRPQRRWPALAGVLAVSQVLTLALFLLRPATPPAPLARTSSGPEAAVQPRPAGEAELGALNQRMFRSSAEDLPPAVPAGALV